MAEDAFALFRLLHPKFDLVVVGHGQEAGVRDPISPRVVLGKLHTSISPCIYKTLLANLCFDAIGFRNRICIDPQSFLSWWI